MIDYDQALTRTTKPDYVLAQAFADITGIPISVRYVQKLMQTHPNHTILSAIRCMGGKKVKSPNSYLAGICKNLSREQHKIAKNKVNLANAVVRLEEEGARENRPTLERPF